MNNLLIGVLVFGLLFGGFAGSKVSKIFPSFNNSRVVEKSQSDREEYFRDKVKGIEYRYTEKTKNQSPAKQTLGQKVGSIIDNFFQLIIGIFIFLLVGSFILGINLFKFVTGLIRKTRELGKALKQTVHGVEKAKIKMNGEKEILKEALKDKQDASTKKLISEIKNEE